MGMYLKRKSECRASSQDESLCNSKKESLVKMVWRCRKDLRTLSGQGTTEYAILVGV